MTSTSRTDTTFYFSINVPYSQCEALYAPSIPNVVMLSESGLNVQIPTNRLRQFVTSIGVRGRFRMIVSADNKIKSFERIR
ncbi:hypothetical protein KUC3_20030 [Alteromonas sp. KC3]|uniref:DUF2835 family protein n=1 Tax=unclassified Alteromonas TaxID=2614992 RepID=UPI001921ED10|nr:MULTISPECIES: DUF2835 family protein [unclassified Alteromonas]BCO19146.1 hypothetical protein KUC3_20030 [Alteromonas sp. KC3]BCO23105.1 hypothetical protein KUC14_19740 [Alteromonas sp. KC14]